MKKRIVLTGGLAATLLLSGCYNTPQTSLRKPGEGPAVFTSGPAVGPGSTAGGSTAGPQPKPTEHTAAAGLEHGKPNATVDTTPAHGSGDHATKPPTSAEPDHAQKH